MIIEEKDNNISIKGAKMTTAGRPENLNPILNYFGLSLIIGLSHSGKSSLIKSLLQNKKLYNKMFHSVYYISPSSTMPLDLPDDKNITLDEEPLEVILDKIIKKEKEANEEEEDDPHNVLIVLDDAVNWLKKSAGATKIFNKLTMNSRHILGNYSSIMVWLVSQRIKSIPYTIRSMANSIYFFSSTNEEKNIMAEEFIGLDKKQAKELMEYVFDKKFNFLYINNFMDKNLRYFKNFNQLVLKNIEK